MMRILATEMRIPKDAEFGLFSLVHGDRFGSAIGRFAIRRPLYAISLAALLSFSAALVSVFEGSLVNENLALDLLHDIGWWNQFLLAFPTLIYIAGAYFGTFPKTLRQLTDSGVLQATNDEWKKVRRYTKTRLSNTSFILAPLVVGASAAALTSNVLEAENTWYALAHYRAGLLIPIHAFLLYYFMTFLAIRLHSAYLILRMLFSYEVNIQPFHPDGSGGLGSLMVQSERLYRGMMVFGIVVALGILSNSFVYNIELLSIYNFLLYAGYVVLAAVAAFLPLYALSASMSVAKLRLIQTIEERYQTIYEKHGSVVSGSSKLSDEHIADLDALKTLQATARAMQVWPFNHGSLVRFACTTATPLLVVLLASLLFG